MKRMMQVGLGLVLVGLFVFVVTREPARPALPRWESQGELMDGAVEAGRVERGRVADGELVRGLLREDLSNRDFEFGVVVEAVSGRRVIAARGRESSGRVMAAISEAMDGLVVELSGEGSPVKGLRRINEGSRFFEDGLLERLDGMEGFSCEVPRTREGRAQRSGYPDLRLMDEVTGDVYYLDPKLMERGAVESSLRSFYFEPKGKTLKVLDDATHLLIGIEHDGNDGDWEFLGYRLVDLSRLRVRLKAEFQASNREVYAERSVLEMKMMDGEDGGR